MELRIMPMAKLAEDALFFMSDLLDDERYEALLAGSDEHIVMTYYTSSDCDDFAIALHRITGWPLVALTNPCSGPLHRLVQAPDGRLLDACGWTSLERLMRRYGVPQARLSEPGGEELALGSTVDDEPGELDDSLHRAASAIRQLGRRPFINARFRQLSMRPIAGVDLPAD